MKRFGRELERELKQLAATGHELHEISRILACSRHASTNTLRREPLPTLPAALNPCRLGCRSRT